ncbi:MAG: 5'-3' exonuclease H3TH domain-containing protein [Patescibacteria group bacterium]
MIKNRLVLIDAFALIFRAYHALPPLTNKEGVQLNAVYGFTSALLSAIDKLEPEYLAVGFDLPTKTVRHEQYVEYKAHRAPTPEDLMTQVPYVREVLKTFNIPVFDKEGFEGEDVIASLISKIKNQKSKLEYIIVTGDLDTLQLVDKQTKVYSMARGVNQAIMYDIEKVEERYGLAPSQFVDFKALKGDASDNIPGVPGIGEKTAAKLIIDYKNLENIYKNIEKISGKIRTLLNDNKEQAFLSQKLSKIITDLDIDFKLPDAKIHDFDYDKVVNIFKKYGFRSLINRLPEPKRENPQQKLL